MAAGRQAEHAAVPGTQLGRYPQALACATRVFADDPPPYGNLGSGSVPVSRMAAVMASAIFQLLDAGRLAGATRLIPGRPGTRAGS